MKKLVEYWIEHNDQHRARFDESTEEALEIGLSQVTEKLKRACEAADRVSGHPRSALTKSR